MFFKTERTTETGIKFSLLLSAIKVSRAAQSALADKYGFKEYRPENWPAFGGFSSIVFNKQMDKRVWKNIDGRADEWMPRLTSREGKAINAEFLAMPVVSRGDLNMCVGFGGAPFKTIGFSYCDTHFGFTTGDEWKFTAPYDCTEITKTEYDNLFK